VPTVLTKRAQVQVSILVMCCKSAYSNCLWPTGHFTKTWQLVGHFQQNV